MFEQRLGMLESALAAISNKANVQEVTMTARLGDLEAGVGCVVVHL